MDKVYALLAVLALVVIGALAVIWGLRPALEGKHAAEGPVAAPAVSQAPAEQPPAVKYPIDMPTGEGALVKLPALGHADGFIEAQLFNLLGKSKALSFLQFGGFVRRFVATVDNLPRVQSAVRLWPVRTTPGAFDAVEIGGELAVSPKNDARYEPFVRFVESIDAGRAVALYKRLYPLFQQAYEELGYPKRYFNDRLIVVCDHLLATTEPESPIRVLRTTVKTATPGPSLRPQYQFADADFDQASSGQKILLRMGTANMRRIKAKIREIRRLLLPPGAAGAG